MAAIGIFYSDTKGKYKITLWVLMCRLHVLLSEIRTHTTMLNFMTLDSSISKIAESFHVTLGRYGIKFKKNKTKKPHDIRVRRGKLGRA